MPIIKVPVPKLGITAHFKPRSEMLARGQFLRFHLPGGTSLGLVPATTLPVDSTGNGSVSCPMDHNDAEGICGPAMCLHGYNIFTYRQGKATELGLSPATLAALLAQYHRVSGGDNGTDEQMLVGSQGIWTPNCPEGGLAGDPLNVVVDSLDIDVTNIQLCQYAIDNFYIICMAWSVPDAFLNSFTNGAIFPNAMTPNPMNGHYTPLADVLSSGMVPNVGTGFYRLYTWGGFAYVSPAMVASVQPQCFIVFHTAQFDKLTGLDSKGRHIVTQAGIWLACGGNPIPASVLAMFPPINGPVNPPPVNPPPVNPPPTPPTPVVYFHINFNKPVPAGQTVRIPPFKAPVNIPQGRCAVSPDPSGKSQLEVTVDP